MLFATLDNLDLMNSLPPFIDGIELRLDLFKTLDLNALEKTLNSSPLPILFTLRKTSQGGGFSGNEERQQELIRKLILLKPHFFDLEYDMDLKFIYEQIKEHPQVKIILSHHNFTKKPLDIEDTYQKMSSFGAYAYKIATLAHSTRETLLLLLLSKKHPSLTIVPMGERGAFGRLLTFTFENKLHYAHLSSKSPLAPGQLSLEELSKIYNYPNLNTDTKLYGLIGNPITNSIGHVYHNKAFKEKNQNALYVKMCINEDELNDFFPLAKKIGFCGLSVTMPLKEKVLPFLDTIDPKALKIKAVNTLLFEKDCIHGINVDGQGALDALENHTTIAGKTIVLLGAGGSSRSIAFEAKEKGANLFIANRTLNKAESLAKEIDANFGLLNELPLNYDILINTIPNLEFGEEILSSALVMDIVYFPKKTLLLEKALRTGCKIVYGEEMFIRQAQKQWLFWNIE